MMGKDADGNDNLCANIMRPTTNLPTYALKLWNMVKQLDMHIHVSSTLSGETQTNRLYQGLSCLHFNS